MMENEETAVYRAKFDGAETDIELCAPEDFPDTLKIGIAHPPELLPNNQVHAVRYVFSRIPILNMVEVGEDVHSVYCTVLFYDYSSKVFEVYMRGLKFLKLAQPFCGIDNLVSLVVELHQLAKDRAAEILETAHGLGASEENHLIRIANSNFEQRVRKIPIKLLEKPVMITPSTYMGP